MLLAPRREKNRGSRINYVIPDVEVEWGVGNRPDFAGVYLNSLARKGGREEFLPCYSLVRGLEYYQNAQEIALDPRNWWHNDNPSG